MNRKALSHKDNEAVQINISGNDVTIDVYVDFIGEENLTTANGTSCKDLAIAGIEQWSGYYLDVFGEDIQVTVNVHEGDSSFWDSQKYVEIRFESDKFSRDQQWPRTRMYNFLGMETNDWKLSYRKVIYMYNRNVRNDDPEVPYTDEQYLRAVTHEMGHVFGIDDGSREYPRPAASSDIISTDDIMNKFFKKLNVSSMDIGMLIYAYRYNEFQHYMTYGKYQQSGYIVKQTEKE